MNWKEIKDKVVDALKAHGFSNRKASAKAVTIGRCKSIEVTIKDPNISIFEIADIVKPFEEIKHDPNGQVIGGAYVQVSKDEYLDHGEPSEALIQAIDEARNDETIEFDGLFIIGEAQKITLASDKYAISKNLAQMWKCESNETIAKVFWKYIHEHQIDEAYKIKKHLEAKTEKNEGN